MKSIVQQYRDLNEGKMSKANFMTNVRRQFPDWISPVNSYQDAISILKSKRILNEDMGIGNKMTVSSAIEHIFDGDFDGDPGKLIMAKELVSKSDHPDKSVTLKMIEKKLEDALDSEESLEGKKPFYLVSDSGEIVDITMASDETEARQYFENEHEGVLSSMTIIHTKVPKKIGDKYVEESLNEAKKKPSTGLTKKEKSTIAKKAKAGKDIGKKGKGFEKVEKAAEKKYGSKEAGEKVAAAAMWKSQAKKKASLKEAKEENEGMYKKVTGKEEYSIFNEIDRVNPYEFKRGLDIEMGMRYKPIPNYFTEDFNQEALVKATKKVLKNLEKNPAYYTNMISAEFEQKSGLKQHPKELKTSPDGLTKIKGFTDAKSNTETSLNKKERAKGSPEGVKEMKPSKKSMGGLKTMKSNDKLPKGVELMKEDFRPGVNLGSAFNKFKQDIIGNKEDFELADENAFEDLVKKYDWYAEMSDDSRKWDAQQVVNSELKSLSKKIGVKRAVELFNKYAPGDRKVTASFFGLQESKIAEDKKVEQLKKIKESIAKKIKEDLKAEIQKALKETIFNVKNPTTGKTSTYTADDAQAEKVLKANIPGVQPVQGSQGVHKIK